MPLRCKCRNPFDSDDDDFDEHEGIYLGILWICRCCVLITVGGIVLVSLMIVGLVDTSMFSRDATIAFGVVGFIILVCTFVGVVCNNPENWPWGMCATPQGCVYFFAIDCCCCVACEWEESDNRAARKARQQVDAGAVEPMTKTTTVTVNSNAPTTPTPTSVASAEKVRPKKQRRRSRSRKRSSEAPV